MPDLTLHVNGMYPIAASCVLQSVSVLPQLLQNSVGSIIIAIVLPTVNDSRASSDNPGWFRQCALARVQRECSMLMCWADCIQQASVGWILVLPPPVKSDIFPSLSAIRRSYTVVVRRRRRCRSSWQADANIPLMERSEESSSRVPTYLLA
jgi:hypothetical protein